MQAAVVAETASKSIVELQNKDEDSKSSKMVEGAEGSADEMAKPRLQPRVQLKALKKRS